MKKVVLFDLDGTLLPMDQDLFVKAYMGKLVGHLAPRGYDANKLVAGMGAGIKAMVKNDGSCTNEEAFWKNFAQIVGEDVLKEKPVLDAFYRNEFQSVAEVCGHNPASKQVVEKIKEMGYRVVLATNPLFPSVATESRIRWAGLAPEDFEFFTTYENSRFCKPNLKYYQEVLEKIGATPEECVMVGNDVSDDMVAKELGMQVFLLTDCLINVENKDISQYPNGGFKELLRFIEG